MIISLRIGPAIVLPGTRQVFVDGVEQRLGGRAFDLLLALAHRQDTVVSKDELYDCVWPGVAVEPNNLPVQVWTLRRVLGEHAIATVPRRGYQLALPVEVLRLDDRAMDRVRGAVGPAESHGIERLLGLRRFLERALSRLEVLHWVTIVGADAEVRRLALRALQHARAQIAPGIAWHWRPERRDQAAPCGLWRHVLATGGLIVAEDIDDEQATRLRQCLARSNGTGVRVLATSSASLTRATETVVDAPEMAAWPGCRSDAPRPLRWRARHCDTREAA